MIPVSSGVAALSDEQQESSDEKLTGCESVCLIIYFSPLILVSRAGAAEAGVNCLWVSNFGFPLSLEHTLSAFSYSFLGICPGKKYLAVTDLKL